MSERLVAGNQRLRWGKLSRVHLNLVRLNSQDKWARFAMQHCRCQKISTRSCGLTLSDSAGRDCREE
jgi:hypothetical protein